jgi:hypothetical protein
MGRELDQPPSETRIPMRATVCSLVITLVLLGTACFADTEIPIVSLTANANGSVTGQLQNGMSVLFSTVPLAINHYDILTAGTPGGPALSIGTLSHSVNNISISLVGGTFTDLTGSLYGVYSQLAGGTGCSLGSTSATAMCDPMWITVNYSNGTNTELQLTDLDTSPDGLNPFSVVAPSGATISSVFIGGLTAESQAKFYALSGLSLSGAALSPASIPEPATITLLGAGLLVAFRKFRRHAV